MWALLPLKDFVQAKQRLAGSLTVSERRVLFHSMVEDVLGVVASYPRFEQVVLVSDDPSAHLLAEHYGVACWPERDFGVRGLNEVVGAALANIHRVAPRSNVMVVHGDLPLLSHRELDAVFDAHAELLNEGPSGLSIVTDHYRRGTNILVCNPARMPKLAYGQASCELHYREAQCLGIPVQILNLSGIAQDIDTSGDLLRLLAMPQNSTAQHTRKFLQESGIAQRLNLMSGEVNINANSTAVVMNTQSAMSDWSVL